MTNNPYATPVTDASVTQAYDHSDQENTEKIIRLHKYAVTSFAFAFGAVIANGTFNSELLALILAIPITLALVVCLLSTIVLSYRLNGLLGSIVLAFFMFVPLLNLFLFAMLLNDAGKRIRAKGYKIGFFGQVKSEPSPQALGASMHPA